MTGTCWARTGSSGGLTLARRRLRRMSGLRAGGKGAGPMRILATLLLAVLAAGCGKAKKDYTVEQMIKDLKDPDHDVRYTAAEVLGDYGPKAKTAVPALREALA